MHELGHTWGANHSAAGCNDMMTQGFAGRDCNTPFCESPLCCVGTTGCQCSRTEIEATRDAVEAMCLDLLSPHLH